MVSLVNKYYLIVFFGVMISFLSIVKIYNVNELRTLNSSLDNEKSKKLVLESKFIELNNKLLYKKSFMEANKNSQINLAMIKPRKIEKIIFKEKKMKINKIIALFFWFFPFVLILKTMKLNQKIVTSFGMKCLVFLKTENLLIWKVMKIQI